MEVNMVDNERNNGGAGIAILIGALILIAFNVGEVKADTIPGNKDELLVWADDCPDKSFNYDMRCKKKIFVEKDILKEVSWDLIEDVAKKEVYHKKTWKDLMTERFLRVEKK